MIATAIDAPQPRRFLLVLWDGGGNIPPQLTIARQLVERGHEVRVLAPHALGSRIEAAGCRFIPYRHAPEHDSVSPEGDLLRDWEPRTPLGAATRARDRLMAAPALDFARDVLDTLDEQPADAVLVDYLLLGAYLGAERARLPLAALVHHIYPFPDPALPPFGLGLQPANGAPGRLRDRLLRPVFARFYGAALPAINASRADLGLAPLASIFDIFAIPDRLLVLTSRAFDFPAAALPGNVRYCGAQLDDSAPLSWDSPWDAGDNRPLVVVSLSTTYQRQGETLRRFISALAGLPVRALVTAGPSIDTRTLPEHSNVAVRSWVPHRAVVPRADLVITHGGHGTVLTALASGVPVLCLPMGRDQADIAARVTWHGAGRSLPARSKPDALRRAVSDMLADPRYRERARQLAGAIAQGAGESSAISELESLCESGAPAPVPA